MNSLGDFSSPGSIPAQAYPAYSRSHGMSLSQPIYPPPIGTKSFSFPTSSVSMKPKSTSGSHNGYQNQNGVSPVSPIAPPKMTEYNGSGYFNHSNASSGPLPKQNLSQGNTKISVDGRVHNLPQSMVNDQYGLTGFLVGMKASKYLGPLPDTLCKEVMTEMSVRKTDEPLYKRFSGPLGLSSEPESFSTDGDGQASPVYPEYLVTQRMISESREVDMNYLRKTWALKMDKFGDDLLFYVFYTFTQDLLQVMAARKLYQNGWRYHMEAKVWLQRMENGRYENDSVNPHKQRGIYKYFDYTTWKVAQIEMILDTTKLEGQQPPVPTDYFAQPNANHNQKF